MKNVKLDKEGTKAIREAMKGDRKVKITINVDAKTLESLKNMATKSGASYQKLLNQILKEGLHQYSDVETRLSRIEKEIDRMKKKAS